MYSSFNKFMDIFEYCFLSTTLGIMLILSSAEIISRYALHLSLAFTEEITINLFVWSVMVGAAGAAKRRHHLGFNLLTEQLSPKGQRYAAIATSCICVFAFILFTVYGFEMVQSQIIYGQKTPALELPEWVMGLAVPVGSIFCILRFIQVAIENWEEVQAISKGVNTI